MIISEFQGAMTNEELLDGEIRHNGIEQSRKLVMAVGLTRSSHQLRSTWEKDPKTYTALLISAVSGYEQYQLVEELLRGAIARLVSIIDPNDVPRQLLERCLDIALRTSDQK